MHLTPPDRKPELVSGAAIKQGSGSNILGNRCKLNYLENYKIKSPSQSARRNTYGNGTNYHFITSSLPSSNLNLSTTKSTASSPPPIVPPLPDQDHTRPSSAMFQLAGRDQVTLVAAGGKVGGNVNDIDEDISLGRIQYPEGMTPGDSSGLDEMVDESAKRLERLIGVQRPSVDKIVVAGKVDGSVNHIGRRYRGHSISVKSRSQAAEKNTREEASIALLSEEKDEDDDDAMGVVAPGSRNVVGPGGRVYGSLTSIGQQYNIYPRQVAAVEEDPPSAVPVLERLRRSLQETYKCYARLERLFDDGDAPIAESFINLALIKESERKEKEKNLARGDLEEKNDVPGGKKSRDYVDERLASHEQLYAVKEPLELTDLFEPKDDTKKPNKVLVLGRAEIGMNP